MKLFGGRTAKAHGSRCQCGECVSSRSDAGTAGRQIAAQFGRAITNKRAFKDAVNNGYLPEYSPALNAAWQDLQSRNPELAAELLADL